MKAKKKVTKKKKSKSVSKKPRVVAKAKKLNKKKGKKKSSLSNTTSANQTIAPHFDTAERNQVPNPDVEMPKGSVGDTYETESRPKGS